MVAADGVEPLTGRSRREPTASCMLCVSTMHTIYFYQIGIDILLAHSYETGVWGN